SPRRRPPCRVACPAAWTTSSPSFSLHSSNGSAFGPARFAYGARMRRLVRVPLVAVFVVGALAACGGGSSKAKAVDTSKDQSNAEAALLKASELPEGFAESSSSSSSDSSDSSSSDAEQASVDDCLTRVVGSNSRAWDADRSAKAQTKFKGSGITVGAEI